MVTFDLQLFSSDYHQYLPGFIMSRKRDCLLSWKVCAGGGHVFFFLDSSTFTIQRFMEEKVGWLLRVMHKTGMFGPGLKRTAFASKTVFYACSFIQNLSLLLLPLKAILLP